MGLKAPISRSQELQGVRNSPQRKTRSAGCGIGLSLT